MWLEGWSRENVCGDNNLFDLEYGTADIDGDGMEDLVVTRDDCGDPQVGQTHWVVYLGTGTGFGAPQQLPLPSVGGPLTKLEGWSNENVCGNDNLFDLAYSTADVTGDGRADLVVTRDDCGDSRTGTRHWEVYPGTGTGFDPSFELSLPDVGPLTQLAGWSSENQCGDYNRFDLVYGTTDIDGDGVLDVVITRDECGDPQVGISHWVLYRGTGTGFEDAQQLPLPSVGPLYELDGFSEDDVCGDDNRFDLAYGTADITGDGRADIVVTRDDCGDLDTGTTHWMVYPGTGLGFDGPSSLPLPDVGPLTQLAGWSDEDLCGNDNTFDLNFGTVDTDGDGLLDLVITRDDCGDPDVGASHWVVYPGVCG